MTFYFTIDKLPHINKFDSVFRTDLVALISHIYVEYTY